MTAVREAYRKHVAAMLTLSVQTPGPILSAPGATVKVPSAVWNSAIGTIVRSGLGHPHPAPLIRRLENDTDSCVQRLGNSAQGAEGMPFVAGGLKPADLLLGGLEELRQVLLGKPGLLAQGR